MSDWLVRAEGLGKAYPKVYQSADRLRALWTLLGGRGKGPGHVVLRDIDLTVRRGESLGVIGENGAGKSTLLKLITGVLTPTTGRVAVNGRVGALLELGAGFHPENTGRDNIGMAAALYGLNGDELRARLPDIIAFADIGSYIDEPVKHYSSGMIVRLGFAVIASLRPDLLITDEVLAVGDESFQKKCVQWMKDYLAGGGTLLLVSHSMYHIQKLCRHALWLRHGEIAASGDVFDVTQAYLAWHEARSAPPLERGDRSGVEFSLIEVELNGEPGLTPVTIASGGGLRVRMRIRSRDGREPVAMVGIARADGTPVYGVSTEMDGVRTRRVAEQEYVAVVEFPALDLLPGGYVVRTHPLDSDGVLLLDTIDRGLTIRGETREMGMVRLPHRWLDDEGMP